MKCRLRLGNIYDSKWSSPNIEILCKKIHTITIDGKTYYKNDYGNDTLKIQNFYRMILKNIKSINYIKHGNFIGDDFTASIEYYIDNGRLHNYSGPALIVFPIIHDYNYNNESGYYIEGYKLTEDEWKTDKKRNIWLRQHKLTRIINES